MPKPSTFHIIDPGLIQVGGHYHTQDLLIARACQKRDISVTIYCRHGANLVLPDINVIEIFRFDLYAEIPQEGADFAVFANYFVVNRAFLQDLNSMPRLDFSPDDLVYFPSLTQNQLEAVADWIIGLPVKKRPIIAITLRFSNSRMHYNARRGFTAGIEFLYRHAMAKLLERHPQTYLFSDTPALSNFYQHITGLPITTLPIPQLEFQDKPGSNSKIHDGGPSVLYIGNTSPYRGFNFMPAIVETVLSEFPDVHFTIQVKLDPESDDARSMVSVSKAHPERVRLLFGTLAPEEYLSTMMASDIILLPYMPSFYSLGSSGVFTEAAALGKILIVTAGTTMETSIVDYGLGATIASQYSAESFSEAMTTTIVNCSELEQKANAARSQFSRDNSPDGFLDSMFNCIY